LGRQFSNGRCRFLKSPAIVAITNRDDVSADLVILECEARGIDVFRFNSEDYPMHLGISVDPARPLDAILTTITERIHVGVSGIWVWRPQWPTIDPSIDDPLDAELARQESVAAIGGLLRLLSDRCVSPPDAMQAARWKVAQLAIARSVGMHVPDSVITSDAKVAKEFATEGPTVAKAVAEAHVSLGEEGRSGYVRRVSESTDWESLVLAPVLMQRQVKKSADLRVTVVGDLVFAARITMPQDSPLDFRAVDPADCSYDVVELEPSLASRCLDFTRHFGLRFGAFDFAIDSQGPVWFLECNPAGQWGWIEDFTGLPITAALVDLLLSLR
jgi:glutathione synthase/RimK-type ligase-like ATP-grasp enzyme